jgi:hypothetical protein
MISFLLSVSGDGGGKKGWLAWTLTCPPLIHRRRLFQGGTPALLCQRPCLGKWIPLDTGALCGLGSRVIDSDVYTSKPEAEGPPGKRAAAKSGPRARAGLELMAFKVWCSQVV